MYARRQRAAERGAVANEQRGGGGLRGAREDAGSDFAQEGRIGQRLQGGHGADAQERLPVRGARIFFDIGQLQIAQIDDRLNLVIRKAQQICATGQGNRLDIGARQQDQGVIQVLGPVVFQKIYQHACYPCSESKVNVSTSTSP